MIPKKTLVILWAAIIMIFPLANVSLANLIENGDFSNGLIGWNSKGSIIPEGNVQVVNEEAILGDNGEFWSALYRPVSLVPFEYTIEFDFKNALSDDPDDPSAPFPFYDTFFASIYFANDISQFNIDVNPVFNVFDDTFALFDLDDSGLFNSNGVVGSSSKGQDWWHFSASFNNTYAYVIPTFELFEMNFIDGDSQVYIDNVEIKPVTGPAPVPEPATLLLFGSGIVVLTGLARRKRIFS